MTVDEFTAAFQEFGQICTTVTNHIHDHGIAFVTHFDIRLTVSAVEKMQTFETHGHVGLCVARLAVKALEISPCNSRRSRETCDRMSFRWALSVHWDRRERISFGYFQVKYRQTKTSTSNPAKKKHIWISDFTPILRRLTGNFDGCLISIDPMHQLPVEDFSPSLRYCLSDPDSLSHDDGT
jgi:hypothetical protein